MDKSTRSVSGSNPAGALSGAAPLRVIVLAGGKAGADPLAQAFGMSHRCLIPLAGRPLVAHVLQIAALHPAVESLAVSVEREAFDGLFDVLSQLPGRGIVKLVEARENIVDSVQAAAQGWDGPLLITTADHALLSAGSIDAMIEALGATGGAEVAVAMATRETVRSANPDDALLFHEFADDAYASCNLYAVAGPAALAAAQVFRGGGQFAGNAWRVMRAFGFVNLVLLRLRAVTLADAMARVSTRLGLRITPVVLEDGSQALDVDDVNTHALAERLLEARAGLAGAAPNKPAETWRALG
ncbi:MULTISPECIES: nucleotidyltransferase family protein [unclassified Novosphingobium]|uniref:nucleotidyltransferase family protein n=1 Tax=unclassified Novosphingobium TaxID=2644732 RepID=UPI00135ADD0F|nr:MULTISPECIES: nucleotidyltransferase family protein [unclassified Novosphingobium]